MSHDTNAAKPISLSLADDDDRWPGRTMTIPSTVPEPARVDDGTPPVYSTHDTHWWDASQIYGHDESLSEAGADRRGRQAPHRRGRAPSRGEARSTCSIRSGRAATSGSALPSSTPSSFASTTPSATRFAATSAAPGATSSSTTRPASINAAVMAKIHTVEWTPAIIAHPTTERGMHANWYGLAGERDPPKVRAARPKRRPQRHPRLADRPPHRSVLPDGGVRLRLPDAPAHPRRVRVPLPRRSTSHPERLRLDRAAEMAGAT